MSTLTLRSVRKSYDDGAEVIKGVDLDIADGEFFSMLGPSGSGKTTVLRLIAGFESATAGTVELVGTDVTKAAPFERDVHTVFQDYALFPHMSVLDNVAYGLRVRGMGKRQRREARHQAAQHDGRDEVEARSSVLARDRAQDDDAGRSRRQRGPGPVDLIVAPGERPVIGRTRSHVTSRRLGLRAGKRISGVCLTIRLRLGLPGGR